MNITRTPDDQIIDLLENDAIGTPGQSLVYVHKNVQDNIDHLPDPYFINLYLRHYLLGTVCFSRRNIVLNDIEHSAYYIRYLYIKEKFRSSGKENRKRSAVESKLRKEIRRLMEGEGLPKDKYVIFYAYVDPGNIRSKRLINEFGLHKTGAFSAIIFSRLFPKKDPRVIKSSISDNPEFLDMIAGFYKDYHLVTFDNLINYDNYYVLMEKDEVICGVQVVPENWKIIEVPGITGNIVMKIVPHIPFLKRLFNPDYRFIYLEGVYCKTGHEKELEALFSTVLACFNVNSAILCMDHISPLYAMIKSLRLGIINSIQGEINMDILVKIPGGLFNTQGLPTYISGIDVM